MYLFRCFLNGFSLLILGILPYILLAIVMQGMSKYLWSVPNSRRSCDSFIYFTAPGVMIHELGHIFFCLLFRHEILEVKLFSPDRSGTLGYVSHRYNLRSYYQRIGNFFIGTGPIWFGVIVIYLLSWFLLPSGMMTAGGSFSDQLSAFLSGFFMKEFWCSWKTLLWIYLCFSITTHITLSGADLEGAKDGVIFMVILIFILSFILGWCGPWEEALIQLELQILTTIISMMVSLFIVLILPIFLFRRFSSKLPAWRK